MAVFGRKKYEPSGGVYAPRLNEIGGRLNRAKLAEEDRTERLLPEEYFEGAMGDLLKSAGIFPDSPENVLSDLAAPAELLRDNRAELAEAMQAAEGEYPYRLEPYLLLPLELWQSDHGWFLAKQLDLLPYRPWNTIMLPADNEGVAETGLPSVTMVEPMALDSAITVAVGEVKKHFIGSNPILWDESNKLFDRVAGRFPELFPKDDLVFTEDQILARRRIRAIAFFYAGKVIGRDTIQLSQELYLSDAKQQLVA